jgi:hypothetical protein
MSNALIKKYKEVWYIPILVSVSICYVCFMTMNTNSKTILLLCMLIPLVSLLTSLALGIIKLFQKNFLDAIFQIIFTLMVSYIAYFIFSMSMMFYPYDFYANNLDLPQNVPLNNPLSLELRDSVSKAPLKQNQFILYNSFQPGLYEYDLTLKSKETGKIYLRAIEITQEDTLSLKLEEMEVIKSDSLITYKTKDHFTIYEGDWGKPYGARLEVWFFPDNDSIERKLLEKNYIIEGWQR